ncbi:MAG: TIM-barrel domain-containing protein, partial [Puniceicoccales bacterium]
MATIQQPEKNCTLETPVYDSFEPVAPGVWRLSFGTPESITPVKVRSSNPVITALESMPLPDEVPIQVDLCSFRKTSRGGVLSLPFDPNEGIYGFGLQLKSHLQSGKKKHLRVNSDPVADTGDSHAPAPFYVSTKGYGVLVDTARYASVYVGTHAAKEYLKARAILKSKEDPKMDTSELYKRQVIGDNVVFEIPASEGIDVYLFSGPKMIDAVSRYNLFSGGGCLPPMWGLGNWYRACARHNAKDVLALTDRFQQDDLPFSVIGLEPGWQTQSYPCSYLWSDRFPNPGDFISRLNESGYRLNLWEHAFIHPESPIAESIQIHSGENLAMDGLVPDFLTQEAREIFTDAHKTLIEQGVSGFKLDECDNSDFISFSWSFSEHDRFPSGADGEQMHCLYGLLYQQTIDNAFKEVRRRTYGLVRSSGALAAPLSGVLYSDLYDHKDFIRGLVNSGFSGHLWSSEVRHAKDPEDLIRRIQTTILSAQSQINGWYIPMPPWAQVNRQLNGEGVIMPEAEEILPLLRNALNLRMKLLPVLYTAFAEYAQGGRPPFRAVVMNFPDDPLTWNLDQQFMIGDNLLAAPIVAGESEKEVYLPAGLWWEFETGLPVKGGQTIRIKNPSLETIPLYVRDGAILPLG